MEIDILKSLEELALASSQKSLNGYFEHLIIDSDPPQPLAKRLQTNPWQLKLYQTLAPLILKATGQGNTKDKLAFVTAPRGHSKTSTLAQFANYCLCFSKRHVSITACAQDQDQAKKLIERMEREASHNPWLYRLIKFKDYSVEGPTGQLEAISSDAPSSLGRLDEIIIMDEICAWRKRDLWDIIFSGKNKRPNSATIIISNSGVINSWQHEIWKEAQERNGWIAHEVPAFSADWLDWSEIERDRKLIRPSLYRRLHMNEWVDQSENPFISREQVNACTNYTQQTKGKTDCKYVAAVDFGSVKDRTAACIMHAEGEDIYLDELTVWQGTPENRMEIKQLESWLESRRKLFNIKKLVADVYQLEQFCQHFEKQMDVERFNFGGSHHYQLADNLRQLIVNRRLHLYPSAGPLTLEDNTVDDLQEELINLVVIEKDGGKYRFDHTAKRHDDRAIVLALGSLALVRMSSGPAIFFPSEPPKPDIKDWVLEGQKLIEMQMERALGK